MSSDTIAWCALAALFAVALLAECLRRYLVARNRPYSASEWAARMKQVHEHKPLKSRIEGDPAVCGVRGANPVREDEDLDAELREMMRDNRGSE